MAIPGRKAQILVEAVDATKSAMDSVERNLGKVNSAAERLSGVLSKVFLAAVTVEFGRKFAAAAIEAERASSRLTAVLGATGYAAGLTKVELDKMAESMAESTQFDDESLRSAQATLLKFGNITGSVFREAMKVSADLAAFMGTNVSDAAQIVGRALQSPTEGLKGFAQQFGKLTDAEEKAINELARAGKTIEAQNAVLDIARSRVGGLAETMNSGLFGATQSVKKEWGELLETMGRSDAFAGNAEKGLRGLHSLLRDIRKELEGERTPLSKLLAETFNASIFVGTMGTFGNIEGDTMPWTIHKGVGVPKIGTGPGLSEDERLRRWEEAFKAQNARFTQPPKLGGSVRSGKDPGMSAERIAQLQVEAEEEAAKTAAEAWGFYTQQRADEQKEFAEGQKRMWQAVFDQIDQEQEQAIEDGKILLDSMNDKLRESEAFARDLGLTFTSAFEDAAISGKKLSDVIKGLGSDIARIIMRRTITDPLDREITKWIGNSDILGWAKNLFGGGRAGGGPVEAGRMYEVTEQGPELLSAGGRNYLMMGAQGGQVSAVGAGAGRGGGPVFNVDMRGASLEAVVRLERFVMQVHGSIERRAVGAVYDANRRGRRL